MRNVETRSLEREISDCLDQDRVRARQPGQISYRDDTQANRSEVRTTRHIRLCTSPPCIGLMADAFGMGTALQLALSKIRVLPSMTAEGFVTRTRTSLERRRTGGRDAILCSQTPANKHHAAGLDLIVSQTSAERTRSPSEFRKPRRV